MRDRETVALIVGERNDGGGTGGKIDQEEW